MKTRILSISMLLSCTILIPFYSQAQAQDWYSYADSPAVHVQYGDLNLESDGGAKILYRRIVAAAEQVCPAYGERNMQAMNKAKICRTAAIERAVREVNRPRLAAIHAKRAAA